jgi:hypothetical protein
MLWRLRAHELAIIHHACPELATSLLQYLQASCEEDVSCQRPHCTNVIVVLLTLYTANIVAVVVVVVAVVTRVQPAQAACGFLYTV